MHKKLFIILLTLAVLIVGCAIFFIAKESKDNNLSDNFTDDFKIDDSEVDWDGNLAKSGEIEEASAEFIQIPGYADLVFTDKVTDVQLINPTDNTVYMVYQIFEGDTPIFETKGISPSKAVECNLGSLISEGVHMLTFKISTYDIDTHEPCNGATQTVKVTRK